MFSQSTTEASSCSGEEQREFLVQQLRFDEILARVQVKTNQLDTLVQVTRRLMREIESAYAAKHGKEIGLEESPNKRHRELDDQVVLATTAEGDCFSPPPLSANEDSALEPDTAFKTPEQKPALLPEAPPPPPRLLLDDKEVNMAFQECASCNKSQVLIRCLKCKEWKHPQCSQPRPCKCVEMAPLKLQILEPTTPPTTTTSTTITFTSTKTRTIVKPRNPLDLYYAEEEVKGRTRKLPPTEKAPPSPSAQVQAPKPRRLVYEEKDGNVCATLPPLSGAHSKRPHLDLLQSNIEWVRELYRKQHLVAAERNEPALACWKTLKGRWKPRDEDVLQYKLVGHCGTFKSEQSFRVNWASIAITSSLLNARNREGDSVSVISAEFADPRDATAVHDALCEKLL